MIAHPGLTPAHLGLTRLGRAQSGEAHSPERDGQQPPSSAPPSPGVMGRRPVIEDELLARAEANRYKMGEHREEDAVRDRHKHGEKTIREQNKVLECYVL